MKKRILSIVLASIMAIGVIPTSTFAAEPVHVLALGDSISTGYGLTNAEAECFTALLGENYTVTNKAVKGNTVSGISQQLKTGILNTKMITEADVITITIGGNDMLAIFYDKIAEMHQTKYNSDISANDIRTILDELNQANIKQNYPLLVITKQLFSKDNANYIMNSQEFKKALSDYQNKLIDVTFLLKQLNPDVKIIVATQYNPYAEFAGNTLFSSLYKGFEDGVSKLNDTIISGATTGGYMIADVKTAFDLYTTDLYHADPNLSSIDLDFHPNANGHIVLAEIFKATIEETSNNNASVAPNVCSFEDISSNDYYAEAVKWATNNGITSGTSTTTFSPDTACTRGQVITFLWRAAGSPAPKSTKMPFTDVPADFYYHDAILWAIENGITAGTSDTTFSPYAKCSRAQIATILWRTQKAPVVSGTNPFNDIAADSYYNNAVLWATSEKIASGTSATTFSPDADCTRAQIVTFLWRFLNHN